MMNIVPVLIGIWILQLATAGVSAGGKIRYNGYALYEISDLNQTQVEFLFKLSESLPPNSDAEFWRIPATPGQSALVLVGPTSKDFITTSLHDAGLKYSLVTGNIQRLMDEEYRQNRRQKLRTLHRIGSKQMHTYYMRYGEILTWMNQMRLANSYVTTESIGKTYEGRDIMMIKISRNTSKPIIWIDSGIHPREWISISSSIFFVDQLLLEGPVAFSLLKNYQFYVVPVVNPDGYVYTQTTGRLWRKNRSLQRGIYCRGTDLNRNFPNNWAAALSSAVDPCSITYRGPSPLSEPETSLIAKKLTELNSKIMLLITLHSFGQYIFYPFAYDTTVTVKQYDKIVSMGMTVSSTVYQKHRVLFEVGKPYELLYAAPGNTVDYAVGDLNIPYGYTVEMMDRGLFGFVLPPSYIVQNGQILFDIIAKFAEMINA